MNQTVTMKDLLITAKDLKSESGENPEYDRALVELVTSVAGYGYEARTLIAAALNIVNAEAWL